MTILDSKFHTAPWIPNSIHWIPDLCKWDCGFLGVFRVPKPRILDSTGKNFPDSWAGFSHVGS